MLVSQPTFTTMYLHLLPSRSDSSVMTGMLAIEVAKATRAEATIASSEVEEIEGVIPVEEAEAPIETLKGRIIPCGPTAEISILKADAQLRTVRKSTAVARG